MASQNEQYFEKNFYRSKKLWAAVVATAMGIAKSQGIDLEWAIYPLLVYLTAQGIADVGKYKKP